MRRLIKLTAIIVVIAALVGGGGSEDTNQRATTNTAPTIPEVEKTTTNTAPATLPELPKIKRDKTPEEEEAQDIYEATGDASALHDVGCGIKHRAEDGSCTGPEYWTGYDKGYSFRE